VLSRMASKIGCMCGELAMARSTSDIFIRPNEHRTLKNPQSKRRIPLVDEVIRLGFLRYHAKIKSVGYKLLFPELRAASDRTPLGDVFYGDWIKVQNAAVPNAAEERKDFHSFRKRRLVENFC
jgi:hypothetical protein